MQLTHLLAVAIVAGSTMVAADPDVHRAALAPAHQHRRMAYRKRTNGKACASNHKSSASQHDQQDSSSSEKKHPEPKEASRIQTNDQQGSNSQGNNNNNGKNNNNNKNNNDNGKNSGSGIEVSQKNGLAWPNGPWVKIQPFQRTMGWLYSWDATPATGGTSSVDFIPDSINFFPMLWGNSGDRIGNWKKYVLNDRDNPRNRAKVAMGPNEVNQAGQSEMSVGDACNLFRQYIIPLKDEDGWSIIGASTNGAPDGNKWMKQFKEQCSDVWNKIDADSLHAYGTDPQHIIDQFTQWHDTFGKPVFITETACMNYDGSATPNLGQQYNYVKKLNEWAHSTDWVKGIAFYGIMQQINIVQNARLASSSGQPTDLFNFWINNS